MRRKGHFPSSQIALIVTFANYPVKYSNHVVYLVGLILFDEPLVILIVTFPQEWTHEFFYYCLKVSYNLVDDLDNINEELFPKVRDLEFLDCILEEGEMLYIPPKWWHYVRSLTTSLSVSFWWNDSGNSSVSWSFDLFSMPFCLLVFCV